MANITWLKDPDEAFRQARSTGKKVLLDFTAAPL
jgi:hypothetical protein